MLHETITFLLIFIFLVDTSLFNTSLIVEQIRKNHKLILKYFFNVYIQGQSPHSSFTRPLVSGPIRDYSHA